MPFFILPELSEEVKREMWSFASLLQLFYLCSLSVFTVLGSAYTIILVINLFSTGNLWVVPQIALYGAGMYVASRCFREELYVKVEDQSSE